MALHKKPTKEELEANIKKAQEKLEDNPKPSPSAAAPSPSNPPPSPSPSQQVPSPSPSQEIPSPSKPPPGPDYKKKFSESSREALILAARDKKMREAVDNAANIPEPTDEEMNALYEDWDLLSESEKRLYKDNIINKRRFEALHKVVQEGKSFSEWIEKVDTFLTNPQTLVNYPSLEGKENEFREFATKPTRRGLEFVDLVSAFLYNVEKTTKPKQKGRMFEVGSGGPNERTKPKSNKISLTEARNLRKTDYKKYRQYVKEGRIDETTIEE